MPLVFVRLQIWKSLDQQLTDPRHDGSQEASVVREDVSRNLFVLTCINNLRFERLEQRLASVVDRSLPELRAQADHW